MSGIETYVCTECGHTTGLMVGPPALCLSCGEPYPADPPPLRHPHPRPHPRHGRRGHVAEGADGAPSPGGGRGAERAGPDRDDERGLS